MAKTKTKTKTKPKTRKAKAVAPVCIKSPIYLTKDEALVLAIVITNAVKALDPPDWVLDALQSPADQLGEVFNISVCPDCDMPCLSGQEGNCK